MPAIKRKAGLMAKRDGIDKLGKFDMCAGMCGICHAGRTPHEPQVMVIRYRESPKVEEYVAKAQSLLIRNKKTGNYIRTIGINCGCYAKVHRQIAHISAVRHYATDQDPRGSIAGSPGHRGVI